MSDTDRISQYYRKKLEQHELTPEEWVAVRYAVIKHTLIGELRTHIACSTPSQFWA
jgi:hypothetical protein